MNVYRYSWCAHFSDQEWVYIIIFAEDRATADDFARDQDPELSDLLEDDSLAEDKKLEVTETAVMPGFYTSILARQ